MNVTKFVLFTMLVCCKLLASGNAFETSKSSGKMPPIVSRRSDAVLVETQTASMEQILLRGLSDIADLAQIYTPMKCETLAGDKAKQAVCYRNNELLKAKWLAIKSG